MSVDKEFLDPSSIELKQEFSDSEIINILTKLTKKVSNKNSRKLRRLLSYLSYDLSNELIHGEKDGVLRLN